MEKQESQFNIALKQLDRVDAYLTGCGEASMELNGMLWLHCIHGLLRELSQELSQEECDTFFNRWKELNSQMQTENNRPLREPTKSIGIELFSELTDLEIDLRRALKSRGMLSKMKDDPSIALGRG